MIRISEVKLPTQSFKDGAVLSFDYVKGRAAVLFMAKGVLFRDTEKSLFRHKRTNLLKLIVVYCDNETLRDEICGLNGDGFFVKVLDNHPWHNQYWITEFYANFSNHSMQCIVLTHDTTLMDEFTLLRDDQIYMVQHDGHVTCMSDFKKTHKEKLTRQQKYLIGRFAKIPKELEDAFF